MMQRLANGNRPAQDATTRRLLTQRTPALWSAGALGIFAACTLGWWGTATGSGQEMPPLKPTTPTIRLAQAPPPALPAADAPRQVAPQFQVQAVQPPAQPQVQVQPQVPVIPFKEIEQGPAPKTVDPLEGRPRLQRLPPPPGGLGKTPVPTDRDLKEYNRFVKDVVDPRNTLDLIQGRARVLILNEIPKRLQISDETIAAYNLLGGKEVTILGKTVGSTVLNLWFADPDDKSKERILSYLVQVLPDPEAKLRLERVYKLLEEEINKTFPNSVVHLRLVGDKMVVTGQAKDVYEATHILRIVRANMPGDPNRDKNQAPQIPAPIAPTIRPDDITNRVTPGLEEYQTAGGPNVVNLLRIPGEQQVMIRVTVAEVNRSAARSIGMNFSVTNNSGVTVFENRTGQIATGGPLAAFGGGATAIAGLATNNLPVALDNGQIRLAINALRTISYAKSIAEPNLVAMNGQTATFQAGGKFPVPIVTGFTASGLQGTEFVPYGVQLNFTPFITEKDRIRMNINASVSTRDTASGTTINGSNVPGLNSRNFQTTVELREGQTLAVAGLVQNNLGADATRVPFFGDIPVLNRFFAFDRISAGEQELIILITPELVHPMDPKEVPPLPGADLFEPTDCEFYLLGRLESRYMRDFRSPTNYEWGRRTRCRAMEQQYLFGPTGYEAGSVHVP